MIHLFFQWKVNKHDHENQSNKDLISHTRSIFPKIQISQANAKVTCNNEVEKWIENTSFQKFVATRFASENINFLLSLQNFQFNPQDKSVADNIFNTYIKDGSVQELNIDGVTRSSLIEEFENNALTLDSFSKAKIKIIELLQSDIFHKFKTTPDSGYISGSFFSSKPKLKMVVLSKLAP